MTFMTRSALGTLRQGISRPPSWHSHNAARCINSSALTIERTQNPRPKPPKEKLTFGTTLSDHMLMIQWDRKKSWGAPKILPFQNLSLSPAASALHYGELVVVVLR